jgi:hypothetical protein
MQTMRAMVAGLLIIVDLWDFYSYHCSSLNLLHIEAGAQGRRHLGCQAAEILLQLAGIAHAHDLEVGVLVQAKEQYAAFWVVGEGGKGLEKVRRGACVSGLGFHALELSMTAAQFHYETLDCFSVHLKHL